MQCQRCGKSDKVTIGERNYCTHCGTVMDQAAPVNPPAAVTTGYTAAPSAGPRTRMNDIALPKPAPAPAAAPAGSATAPVSPTAPVGPAKAPVGSTTAPVSSTPVGSTSAPASSALANQNNSVGPNPAQRFHAAPTPGSPKVLDLSRAPVTGLAVPAQPSTAANTPAKPPVPPSETAVRVAAGATNRPAAASPAPSAPVAPPPAMAYPVPAKPVVTPPAAAAPASPASTAVAATDRKEARLARAATIGKSEMVQKFVKPTQVTEAKTVSATPQPRPTAQPAAPPAALAPRVPMPPAPQAVPAPVAARPAPPSAPTSPPPRPAPPSITTALPATRLAPAPATPPTPPRLPNEVATQIAAMQGLIPPVKPAQPAAAPVNPSAGPSPAGLMAAIAAIAIIGGVIWQNNYPNIALQSAAQKAGIQANLPSYVPSSYRLDQQITYGPGQLSLRFSAPGDSEPLTITQRKTNWNSTALLEYYIAPKTKHYISVQSQGLTIYLYNNHDASWVNKGMQYVIEGNTRLNRDQIIKIAESL